MILLHKQHWDMFWCIISKHIPIKKEIPLFFAGTCILNHFNYLSIIFESVYLINNKYCSLINDNNKKIHNVSQNIHIAVQ